ncbi:FadR/GntR family transcriptional regulator [Membranihabitans marinus]|uniref:FadR/GntR family transcriptional regulator n=1 Tax=Membranihabitans marinus TaxID=1227546 RepID=UPI001F3C7FCB|nr:FadR/GntR family transcriptional regulator [Membranihabitans marinus]
MNSKQSLTPLDNISLTDRVENNLRAYFLENAFKPGDSLPGENEIAEKLNVSRNVVREALSRLRMLGIIESRTRRGMIMARPDILGGLERVLNPFILGKDTLKDIFEMRLILEIGMAEFLFLRKTDKDIEELEVIIKNQSSIHEPTIEEEIEFHTKLYDMTGNETFTRFQVLLIPLFNHVFSLYKKNNKVHQSNHIYHKDLVNILKSGTVEDFRLAMKKHLAPYFKITD